MYALFADDLRILFLTKEVDLGYNILLMVCCILFMVEVVLSMKVKSNYKWSFFMWLDIVSSLTLVIDLTWVSELIMNLGNSGGLGQSSSIARAGRASRIGTKAGRIVRIIRLIRLVKIFKIV